MKKITKNIFILSLFLIISSCSLHSLNRNISSTYKIRNGSFEGKYWNESLVFKRYSWLDQLSTKVDLMIMDFDKNSKFNSWFDNSSVSLLEDCSNLLIVIAYFKEPQKYGFRDLKQDLKKSDLIRVSIPSFEKNLRSHPQVVYNENEFYDYKINGFCLKNKTKLTKIVGDADENNRIVARNKENTDISISINVPGTKKVTIKLP